MYVYDCFWLAWFRQNPFSIWVELTFNSDVPWTFCNTKNVGAYFKSAKILYFLFPRIIEIVHNINKN